MAGGFHLVVVVPTTRYPKHGQELCQQRGGVRLTMRGNGPHHIAR